MEITEHCRKLMAIILPMRLSHFIAIDINLARMRSVESSKQTRKGRFTTAITANNEDVFATFDLKINRAGVNGPPSESEL